LKSIKSLIIFFNSKDLTSIKKNKDFVINGFIFSITAMVEFNASQIDFVSTYQQNQIGRKF